jgi:hypothetical protein
LLPDEQARLAELRADMAAELPDLVARNHLRHEAAAEATLSGELRRAVHASTTPLAALAQQVGVTPLVLDEFLTGERTLRSDVLDRLAQALGYQLQKA